MSRCYVSYRCHSLFWFRVEPSSGYQIAPGPYGKVSRFDYFYEKGIASHSRGNVSRARTWIMHMKWIKVCNKWSSLQQGIPEKMKDIPWLVRTWIMHMKWIKVCSNCQLDEASLVSCFQALEIRN